MARVLAVLVVLAWPPVAVGYVLIFGVDEAVLVGLPGWVFLVLIYALVLSGDGGERVQTTLDEYGE